MATKKSPSGRTPSSPKAAGVSHPLPSAIPTGKGADKTGHTPTLEELSKRLRGLEGAATDEDVSQAITQHWQKFAGAIVAALLVVWLASGIRTAWEEKSWESADMFMQAQQSYSTIMKSTLAPEGGPVKEDAAKAAGGFDETMKALQSSDDTAYRDLAKLYQASKSLVKQEPAEAAKVLATFDTAAYSAEGTVAPKRPIVESDITGEFAALLYARSLLDGTPEQVKEGKQRLLGLSYGGQFLNGEALLALARVSAAEEDRGKARSAASALGSSRSEALEQVSGELNALGIKQR